MGIKIESRTLPYLGGFFSRQRAAVGRQTCESGFSRERLFDKGFAAEAAHMP